MWRPADRLSEKAHFTLCSGARTSVVRPQTSADRGPKLSEHWLRHSRTRRLCLEFHENYFDIFHCVSIKLLGFKSRLNKFASLLSRSISTFHFNPQIIRKITAAERVGIEAVSHRSAGLAESGWIFLSKFSSKIRTNLFKTSHLKEISFRNRNIILVFNFGALQRFILATCLSHCDSHCESPPGFIY